jgi:hypothetical protein
MTSGFPPLVRRFFFVRQTPEIHRANGTYRIYIRPFDDAR